MYIQHCLIVVKQVQFRFEIRGFTGRSEDAICPVKVPQEAAAAAADELCGPGLLKGSDL